MCGESDVSSEQSVHKEGWHVEMKPAGRGEGRGEGRQRRKGRGELQRQRKIITMNNDRGSYKALQGGAWARGLRKATGRRVTERS